MAKHFTIATIFFLLLQVGYGQTGYVIEDQVSCDGNITLTPNIGNTYRWFSDIDTSNLITQNTPLVSNTILDDTTFYLVYPYENPQMPAATGVFGSHVRGYWFEAPTDFKIVGLSVPKDANSSNQHIAVLKFNSGNPPVYPTTTNDFQTLVYETNVAADTLIVDIDVAEGDIIGILGNRGNFNSYGSSGQPINIMGHDVSIERLGMQYPLSSTAPKDIWQELNGSISRVEMILSAESNGFTRKHIDVTAGTSSGSFIEESICEGDSVLFDGTYRKTQGLYFKTLSNSFGCDSVVTLNLTVNQPSTGIDVQEACDSFTWIDGNTYTSDNFTATHTLTNAAGCDSVVTLNLTILESNTGIDIQEACDSFTWIDGNTYTSDNFTATHTLPNAAGCDSVVTLNLTILESNTGIDVQEACDSFTWIDGNTYTSDNFTATHTLTNAVGCDSVVTLNLTILESNTGIDIQEACDSFTWIDGNTYISDNFTATHTLTNAAGCDSVVTLNLTILESNTGIDIQEACDAFTWIDGNTYTSDNFTATHTLTNAAGCDSVVTLNLTILESSTGIDIQEACDSYTWIDGNTYTSDNFTATHTLTNAVGCDSVVTLNLTILPSTTGIDVQEACFEYTWIDGNTYTASNYTATHTLVAANGCDSIVTLNLTIQDIIDPEIEDIVDQTISTGVECMAQIPDYTSMFTATDNCGVVSFVQDVPAGTLYEFGSPSIVVTLTAADAAGNSTDKSFNVHFDDNYEFSITEVNYTHVTNCPDDLESYNSQIIIETTVDSSLLDYSIHNGFWQHNNNHFIGVDPGTYQIYARNDNGCIHEWPTPIEILPASDVTLNSLEITGENICADDQNVAISIFAESGNGDLVYSFDGGNTFTENSVIDGLAGGSYQIVIQDIGGCEYIHPEPIEVFAPEAIDNITLDIQNITGCNGSATGALTVYSGGGTGELSYSVDGGNTWQNNSEFLNLTSGLYYIMVKDENDCMSEYGGNPVNLLEPFPLVIQSINMSEPECHVLETTIAIVATGGHGGYDYSIDNGATWTSGSSFTITEGEYNIWVRDANMCEVEFLNNPIVFTPITSSDLTIIATPGTEVCAGEQIHLEAVSDGIIEEVLWNDGAYLTQHLVSEEPGEYTYEVWITNDMGCESTAEITVEFLDCTIDVENLEEIQLSIFPNPSNGRFTVEFDSKTLLKATLYDLSGRIIYSEDLNNTTGIQELDIQNLSEGMYILQTTFEGNIVVKTKVTVK
jgi:hypothetical protein